MKWLLEPAVFKGDLDPFIEELDKRGQEYILCQFGKSYEDFIEKICNEGEVLVIGSFQFVDFVKRKRNWRVYCNLPKLDCTYYYPRFGDELLNAGYYFLPFGDLKRREKWILRHGPVFIRPTSVRKSFGGQVVNNLNDICKVVIDPETLVVVAPKIDIVNEWRMIVCAKKVTACSQYKENGKVVRIRGAKKSVTEYVEKVLSSVVYNPEYLWVMDIAETSSGELKVLEVGPFSCSGFYACDPVPIIESVNLI